jgi:hypothetical protein
MRELEAECRKIVNEI